MRLRFVSTYLSLTVLLLHCTHIPPRLKKSPPRKKNPPSPKMEAFASTPPWLDAPAAPSNVQHHRWCSTTEGAALLRFVVMGSPITIEMTAFPRVPHQKRYSTICEGGAPQNCGTAECVTPLVLRHYRRCSTTREGAAPSIIIAMTKLCHNLFQFIYVQNK